MSQFHSQSDANFQQKLIRAYAGWMEARVKQGEKLYYVNVMFEPLDVPRVELLPTMRKGLERFYAHFVTRFVHHPTARGEQQRLPEFWLFPDLPVPKRNKYRKRKRYRLSDVTINDGLHFNGALIVKAALRETTGSRIRHIVKHFVVHQREYARNGIANIDVRRTDRRFERLANYALKTVTAAKVDPNDIVIFPKALSELVRRL